MDAVKFLQERSRMCKFYMTKGPCFRNGCPMTALRVKLQEDGPHRVLCSSVLVKLPEEAVALVEKWSEDNPIKTRSSDLLEKLPNVRLSEEGCPTSCALNLGYCNECIVFTEGKSCKECWETPMEEG